VLGSVPVITDKNPGLKKIGVDMKRRRQQGEK